MFAQYNFFNVIEKFPIKNIKKKKLKNKLNIKDVFYMLVNFDKDVWIPPTLDDKYFLIEGQHRLELAKQMGLEYIDVVVQLDSKLQDHKIINKSVFL